MIFFIFSGLAFAYETDEIIFRIERGDGLTEIAQKLKNQGLISSTSLFKIYSFLIGGAHRFQPGIYRFKKEDGLFKITKSLVRGPAETAVVINEGLTLRDIDFKLSRAGIIREGELIDFAVNGNWDDLRTSYWFLKDRDSLEGFLFPDTYKFYSGTLPKAIVKIMLDNFNVKIAPLLSTRKDWYSMAILASLLEREVADETDRQKVSYILQKRMAIGLPLQVDAAVLYVKCGGRFLSCVDRKLARADFKVNSLYNTYLHKELPPTPIANPGLMTIKAVLNPQKNPHLFYLSDPATGKTIFSVTFEEHNEKRKKYLNL